MAGAGTSMAGDPIFTNVVMNVHPPASDVHGRVVEFGSPDSNVHERCGQR
jgi:hypothetical protein